jgi:hypothetical protein
MSRQNYGIENLALTVAQRDTLVSALRTLGENTHPNPCMRNHWRVRLDNQAVIFEASRNDEDWTVSTIRQRLANIFGANVALATASTATTAYGPVVTISYSGTPRLRMIAFGGLLATWEESHDAALAFLAENSEEWEARL